MPLAVLGAINWKANYPLFITIEIHIFFKYWWYSWYKTIFIILGKIIENVQHFIQIVNYVAIVTKFSSPIFRSEWVADFSCKLNQFYRHFRSALKFFKKFFILINLIFIFYLLVYYPVHKRNILMIWLYKIFIIISTICIYKNSLIFYYLSI